MCAPIAGRGPGLFMRGHPEIRSGRGGGCQGGISEFEGGGFLFILGKSVGTRATKLVHIASLTMLCKLDTSVLMFFHKAKQLHMLFCFPLQDITQAPIYMPRLFI